MHLRVASRQQLAGSIVDVNFRQQGPRRRIHGVEVRTSLPLNSRPGYCGRERCRLRPFRVRRIDLWHS